MRVYEMFMGPLEVTKPWLTAGLIGVSRFLERLWAIGEKPLTDEPGGGELLRLLHKTIKKVSADTETLNFNTAISQMMIFSAGLSKEEKIPRSLWEPFVIMISAYAPHLGEELWEKLGHRESVSKTAWPAWDEKLAAGEEAVIVVQVNGRVRDRFSAPRGTAKEELEKIAWSLPGTLKWTEGKTIVRIVTVPDKLVNIVVQD
jgi:leucyl-tRNA synthetase